MTSYYANSFSSSEGFEEMTKLENEFYKKILSEDDENIHKVFKEYFPKMKEKLKTLFSNSELAIENLTNTYLLICYQKSASLKNLQIGEFLRLLTNEQIEEYKKLMSYFQNFLHQ